MMVMMLVLMLMSHWSGRHKCTQVQWQLLMMVLMLMSHCLA